jgi:hypothetical protein
MYHGSGIVAVKAPGSYSIIWGDRPKSRCRKSDRKENQVEDAGNKRV